MICTIKVSVKEINIVTIMFQLYIVAQFKCLASKDSKQLHASSLLYRLTSDISIAEFLAERYWRMANPDCSML